MKGYTFVVVAAYIFTVTHCDQYRQKERVEEERQDKPVPYAYKYFVNDPNTGDHKVHEEVGDGGVVKGFYSFREPDGRLREVHYMADEENGFKAMVRISGSPIVPPTPYPPYRLPSGEYLPTLLRELPGSDKYFDQFKKE